MEISYRVRNLGPDQEYIMDRWISTGQRPVEESTQYGVLGKLHSPEVDSCTLELADSTPWSS